MNPPDSDIVHYAVGAAMSIIGYFLIALHRRVEKHLDEANEVGGPQALTTLRHDFDQHERIQIEDMGKMREGIAELRAQHTDKIARLDRIEAEVKQVHSTVLGLASAVSGLSSSVSALSTNVTTLLQRGPIRRN